MASDIDPCISASPAAEAMVQDWLTAPDVPAQTRIARQLGRLALDEVATVPLGQFTIRTVVTKRITGVLQGVAPYPWNVRPA